jgi:hypothetical protein
MENKRAIIRWLIRQISGKEIMFDDEFYKFVKPPKHLHNIIDVDYGHLNSQESGMCVDKNGEAIPWFTYPTIEYLSQFDLTNLEILEWGCGNSSVYFSKRCKVISSVEHNAEWFELVKNKKLPNHHLILTSLDDYPEKAKSFEKKFDIIIVDGERRHECIEVALELINAGGIIILDNSDRHPDIGKKLRDNGYLEVDFHGFGPIGLTTWTTTLFFSSLKGLTPLSIQPVIPIGGINNNP